jgi:hypothetical protein
LMERRRPAVCPPVISSGEFHHRAPGRLHRERPFTRIFLRSM